jgi:hypothetical protein
MFVYRIDLPDGFYVLGTFRSPLRFNENPLTGHVTFGGTIVDKGTIYDADGTVIGRGIFHARFHTTIVDGTVVVEFDEGYNRCL